MGELAILLTMTRHERYAAQSAGAACLVNIGLNIILVPAMGITGAALATAVSLAIWSLILRHYAQRALGIGSGYEGI
jgi:O-antigen/teichoic acid export membrane protein